MAISDYYDLIDTVARWLERPSMSQHLPDLIKAGEVRLCDDVRLRAMEVDFSKSIASGDTTLTVKAPLDFMLAFKGNIYITEDDSRTPLTERSKDYILTNYAPDLTDKPEAFYISGDGELTFNCEVDDDYTVSGTYYRRLHLSEYTLTNWILETYPYAIVYASLIEAMLFLEDDPRRFEAMYMEQLDRMRRRENREKGDAGPRVWRQCSL
jgi:hypothetical protein